MKKLKNIRYSDNDLKEFKTLILDKLKNAQDDLDMLEQTFRNNSDNGTNDTSHSFKGYDEGSETMSKELNALLATRQEHLIRDLKHALVRIENKTYGTCRITGKLIKKERLKLVPHATLSIEAKKGLL